MKRSSRIAFFVCAIVAVCGVWLALLSRKDDAEYEVSYECSAVCGKIDGEGRGIDIKHYLQGLLAGKEDILEKCTMERVFGGDVDCAADVVAIRNAMKSRRIRYGRDGEKPLKFVVSAQSGDVRVADMVAVAYLESIAHLVSLENSGRMERMVEQAHMHAEKARLLLLGLRRVEPKLRDRLPQSSPVVRHEIDAAREEYERLVREEANVRMVAAECDVVLSPCGVTTNNFDGAFTIRKFGIEANRGILDLVPKIRRAEE